ncbi:MAG: ATP-binding cassette domain-containing protein [Myxococcota bacterium]
MHAFDEVRGEGLVKLFGRTRALGGVDVHLRAGEVTVIEGPNGSGKSTLLALLALLASPTRGTLRYGSFDARSGRMLRRHIGVLSHAAMLYPDLSGAENLAFFAGLLAAPDARVKRLRDRFEIAAFGERPLRTYSRGQLQRVALARALLGEPALLLLDEPSTGLDLRGTERLVEAVRTERARGAIVAVVTHDPSFADAVADTRVRLRRGKREAA